MDTVVSGIRSTGNLHLGNYFGAIKNFLKMQTENNCYFFIADYHALTTHPKPGDLHGNIKQVLQNISHVASIRKWQQFLYRVMFLRFQNCIFYSI